MFAHLVCSLKIDFTSYNIKNIMQGNFDYKSTFMRNTPYQIQAPKPKVLLTSARNVLGDYSNASYWKFNNITHKQSYVDTSINRY